MHLKDLFWQFSGFSFLRIRFWSAVFGGHILRDGCKTGETLWSGLPVFLQCLFCAFIGLLWVWIYRWMIMRRSDLLWLLITVVIIVVGVSMLNFSFIINGLNFSVGVSGSIFGLLLLGFAIWLFGKHF